VLVAPAATILTWTPLDLLFEPAARVGTPQLGPEQVKAGGLAFTPQLASASAATNATLYRMLLFAFHLSVYKFKFDATAPFKF
jgi:hypothetical protein